jgi:hypothetical protein
MPRPTLLTQKLRPRWIDLSPDQRCCWHFDAARKPVRNAKGVSNTLYGYQYFYNRNVLLIVADDSYVLDDPPQDHTAPEVEIIPAMVWPNAARRADGTTTRRPSLWLQPQRLWPENSFGIVRQGYAKNIRNPPNRPRPRHVKIVQPLTLVPIFLTVPNGYFATTNGLNRFATIKGGTAARVRDKPVARVLTVSRTNGSYSTYPVPNPYGGAPTGTKRKRHEDAEPNSGQPLTGIMTGQDPVYINTNNAGVITT